MMIDLQLPDVLKGNLSNSSLSLWILEASIPVRISVDWQKPDDEKNEKISESEGPLALEDEFKSCNHRNIMILILW